MDERSAILKIDEILKAGEHRKNAGCLPAFRRLAYPPPAGDGDYENPRNWLNEQEKAEIAKILKEVPTQKQQAIDARKRIIIKIIKRRISQISSLCPI